MRQNVRWEFIRVKYGVVSYLFVRKFFSALTERPPMEHPSDISTRMERPLDDWSTVTGRPL
jgi:hypothetical protein